MNFIKNARIYHAISLKFAIYTKNHNVNNDCMIGKR